MAFNWDHPLTSQGHRPPKDQPKRRGRRLIVIVSMAIIILCTLGSLFAYDRNSADDVVEGFCRAIDGFNFVAAHDLLSDRAQRELSVADLGQLARHTLETAGWLYCTTRNWGCGETGTNLTTATVVACFNDFSGTGTYSSGTLPGTGTFYLVRDGLQWRIDRIDAPFYRVHLRRWSRNLFLSRFHQALVER